MSAADVTCEEYERLALQMLAVQAGDFADVKDAMRKIIASAPEGADVAFVLSRALAHAGDRALQGEALSLTSPGSESIQPGKDPVSVSRDLQETPSRWWVAATIPLLAAATMFWWLGEASLGADATDGVQMTATSMFTIGVGLLGSALIGVETVLLRRWDAPRPVAARSCLSCPPAWYLDPWDQGTSRWWDGSPTGRLGDNRGGPVP